MVTIATIPSEVFPLRFGYSDLRDLGQASSVCRLWHEYVESILNDRALVLFIKHLQGNYPEIVSITTGLTPLDFSYRFNRIVEDNSHSFGQMQRWEPVIPEVGDLEEGELISPLIRLPKEISSFYNRLLSKFALPEKIEDFFEGSNSADETYTRCISESAEFDPSEKDRF